MNFPSDMAQVERDFLSGRNPLGYIPVCQNLRRQKNYQKALELCVRGLASDPDSLAGKTLHARLLADMGRYEDSLREISRMESRVPDAMGLAIEKARCLVSLRRFDEARMVLHRLNERNPMSPDVQDINAALSRAERSLNQAQSSTSREVPRILRTNTTEILEVLRREMSTLVELKCAAVIPVAAGVPAVEGDALLAEAAYEFYKNNDVITRDLEAGPLKLGIFETDTIQIIVLVRRKAIVSVSFEPTPQFGKILHRFQIVVAQLLPESA